MPKKLDDCVKKLMKQGRTEESAYAICQKSISNDNVTMLENKIDNSTGFLNAKVVICRSGIQEYLGRELGLTGEDAGKFFNVLRHPDDVTNDESLATYKNLTITDEHPPERWVDLNNIKIVQRGQVSDIAIDRSQDEVHITGVMSITDEGLINKSLNGKIEVSLGYAYELIAEDGVYNGTPYQFKYTNMIANHLSVVDKGRCGPSCHITNDKKYDIINSENKVQKGDLVKIKINGKEFDVPDDLHEALMAERKSSDAEIEKVEKKAEDAEETIKEKQKSNDALEAKVDNLEAKLKTATDSMPDDVAIDAMVNERAALVSFAKSVIGNDAMPEGTCPMMLKKAVVAKHFAISTDGKSDAYVDARYEMVQEDMLKQADSVANLTADMKTKEKVATDNEAKVSEARANYMKKKGL